ncbi:hypothetical protein M9458_057677, partial [Cirrhinus mrigala]
MEMQDLLQRLTEVSIRQQQIVEHLATRQGRTEEELAAVRVHAAQHVPLPDPPAQATHLLPKMTAYDDVEAFLKDGPSRNGHWHPSSPMKRNALILNFSSAWSIPDLLPGNFHDWEYKARGPARAQAAELARIAQHWLLEGEPTATQVVEQVVIDPSTGSPRGGHNAQWKTDESDPRLR